MTADRGTTTRRFLEVGRHPHRHARLANAAWPDSPNCTAASASPTNTGRWTPQRGAEYWHRNGEIFDPSHRTDAESNGTIVRITGGNFRLIERLATHLDRILTINNLDAITAEAIEAVRETLVAGS